MTEELLIPQGINYECQGCGICCSGWTIPMTEADYQRISTVEWGDFNPEWQNSKVLRPLQKHEKEGTPYSYKIHHDDETCPFLVNKLCFIHGQKGSEFKPSMCQLFPYSFIRTPSGTYLTVSFVSMAVCYNQGLALTEQGDWLEKKRQEFYSLYPDFQPDWSKLQLATGLPLSWEEYIKHENRLLAILQTPDLPVMERLLRGSAYLANAVRERSNSGQTSSEPVELHLSNEQLNKLDRHLLTYFHRIYFPHQPPKLGGRDFRINRFILQLLFEKTWFRLPSQVYALFEVMNFPYPANDKDMDDLLYRFAYQMIFGKKIFGPMFGHLSLNTGFNHLIMAICVARLHARALAKARKASITSLVDLIQAIRMLERGMGETRFGGYSAAALELFLQSPSRAERFLSRC